MVWNTGSADAPFHARHFQLFISVGLPESSSVTDELIACREGLIGVLRSLDIPVENAGPEEPHPPHRRSHVAHHRAE